ncbi:glutamine amidotransferase [Wielerella bovis]|uniref:glutamine amidotransferase n=1 Tax=Wielerella bovis TaxID=2917790 RepID=UPI002018D004|nr:glutamine amidotransferase [Wielerella bovis]ULJ66975.1 glutamine amidotransferase [Wielerella bovis]
MFGKLFSGCIIWIFYKIGSLKNTIKLILFFQAAYFASSTKGSLKTYPERKNMKPLLIIETGHAFADIIETQCDFSDMIAQRMPNELPIVKVDAMGGEKPQSPEQYSGVILTGSHAMVSDKEAWSEATAQWLREAVAADLPVFGICYGHQLLAHALDGESDYNPKGAEIGTFAIQTTAAAQDDPLFCDLPKEFAAQTSHSQSALKLPANAVALANNSHENHHAFRFGRHAWGVQFHPEFNAQTMSAYTKHQADKLTDEAATLAAITETPEAERLLQRFGEYVLQFNQQK